jgi:poly-gamma-glutamate capsule biosynthesis protein CapA/YwtB (metallophosphatase superfamily)
MFPKILLAFGFVLLFFIFCLQWGQLDYAFSPPDQQSPHIDPNSEAPGASQNIKLTIGGDVMLSRTVGPNILYNNFDPLRELKPLFKESDLTVVNLEYVAASGNYAPMNKKYTFIADTKTLSYLKKAGVDVVSVANNHAGDYGVSAFLEQLQNLNRVGIGFFGGGKNINQAYAPLYVEIKNITVAFIGFNSVETPYFAATSTRAGHAWIDEQQLKKSIKTATQVASVVIVMPHWGLEYTDKLGLDQTKWGRLAIDAGADLVIGSHPHHIQPSEKYKQGEIFYSMGNLVFDGPGPAGWNDGQLIEVEITLDGQVALTKKIDYYVNDRGLVRLK